MHGLDSTTTANLRAAAKEAAAAWHDEDDPLRALEIVRASSAPATRERELFEQFFEEEEAARGHR